MDKTRLRKRPDLLKKIKKLMINPGVFFRDFLNKRYPEVYNEIRCQRDDEVVLLKSDLILESRIKIDEPIDVVFTWVNDKDIDWQEKYHKYKGGDEQKHGKYAIDMARFSNHNELYYSIKSVLINMPWVRNIYVVTDNQKPDWINEYDKVIIIDHEDIISRSYLPTFNSHVIEAHLFKIPGLSERFIYFNDDVFVARPLPVGHFFKGGDTTSIFVSGKSLSEMKRGKNITPTLSASLKAGELFERDFAVNVDTPLVHTYVPLMKSVFEEVWQKYEKEINLFLNNKFRTNYDLNMATFMVPWYTFIKGKGIPVRDICYYFNIRSPVARKHYQRLMQVKSKDNCPHSFCANDFTSTQKSMGNYQVDLINMLKDFYR
ncbi:MAG: Stealth CR1 domain-containing protein [Kluyvera ascorbata]